jgi:site-specific DNA recombinase
MRAVIYARYSSDLQREASIEDQVRICRARAHLEGWDIVEIFTDQAISGSTLLRPGYQALMAFVRRGGADVVVAESLDRFSRDQEHIAAFYKQISFGRARIFTLAEGDVSELHIGLKGTMGALYLKDLAAKTHRGLEGRVRAGRSIGKAPYGYRVVRRLGENGEPERGLRAIDEAQAVVVRRIFADYAAGVSPRSIARALNTAGVPGPAGGIWHDTVIRGRASRDDGMLRNHLYVGRLVWNRLKSSKDPLHGTRVRRANPAADIVATATPDLAIIDITTWNTVQERLVADALPAKPDTLSANQGRSSSTVGPFWERRRPRRLLSSKVFCGLCGKKFTRVGKDYLACPSHRMDGCRNAVRPRRARLEAAVLAAFTGRLMQPHLVDAFIEEFNAAWVKLRAESKGDTGQYRREMQDMEKRIRNLVDALADGIRAPDIQSRLDQFMQRRAELETLLAVPAAITPLLPANLGEVYRAKLATLQAALAGPDSTEAREAARRLIDKVIITPASNPDDPAEIELVGDILGMLCLGGLQTNPTEETQAASHVFDLFTGSVKEGLRASPLDPNQGGALIILHIRAFP